MSNVINLLEHPKFLKNKPPQEEPNFSVWATSLSDYFKNQPTMTLHLPASTDPNDFTTAGMVFKSNEKFHFADFGASSWGAEEETTPDYLIVMDLLEDYIKEGNYRSAKAAVEMLDDIVERMEKKTLDKPD